MGFWDDVASAASAVGDVVEGVVDTVTDAVTDTVNVVADTVQDAVSDTAEAVCDSGAGGAVCGAANVAAGVVNGGIEWGQDFTTTTIAVAGDLGDAVADVFRLDIGGAIDELAEAGLHLVEALFAQYRSVGYMAGGTIDEFQRADLRSFVSDLIDARFADDEERRQRIRAHLNLDSGRFGLPLAGEHRILELDSARVNLAAMHQDGTLDLFELAGLGPGVHVSPRAQTEVVRVDDEGNDQRWWPVNRSVIQAHLDTGRHRLRVYAMQRDVTAQRMESTQKKLRDVGVKLAWNDPIRYARWQSYTTLPVGGGDFRLDPNAMSSWVVRNGLRGGTREEERTLLALAIFHFTDDGSGELFGVADGRLISEGTAAARCPTPGRDDACCARPAMRPEASGSVVAYRDLWPDTVFRHVLPHEAGHWLGLCHTGHNGFDNLMFSGRVNSALSWSLIDFAAHAEPGFTGADAKNVWRFLVDQLPEILEPPAG